jgi:hypothetical protein
MTSSPAQPDSATRADLLALAEEALVALANRGLVKRAAKDVEAGQGPSVRIDADGTVCGVHPDGTTSTLPPGAGLTAATCSCAATGVCRHLLATVLAYQRRAGTRQSTVEIWSPGEFSDAELEAALGPRLWAAADRARRAGYTATVHRATEQRPEPSVELPTCTVRFLVPHDLSYARTDVAAGLAQEAVALAVWAFRVADELFPQAADCEVSVGGRGTVAADGLAAAVALVGDVLTEGIVHLGPSYATTLARVARDLDARGLRWPLLAVLDLAEQLSAYQRRAALHHPELVADLLAEIVARYRCAASTPGRLGRVLGTDEPAETPLRRVRLTGLGCRVTGVGDERTGNERRVDIYLAAHETGQVLVLRRDWPGTATGAQLASRRVGGARVQALAYGTVVTESAWRRANRLLRLAADTVGRTTVTPSDGNWDTLPPNLLVPDLAAVNRELAEAPPRFIRPRIEAESVRAVVVDRVESIGYRPGAQRLDAVVTDPSGGQAVVSLRHDPVTPAALDALAEALAAGPRFLSGALRRHRGQLVIEPFALVVGTEVTVPALAPGDGSTALAMGEAAVTDPLGAALDEGLALLADLAHRGLRHAPASIDERLRRGADDLGRVGLARCAQTVRDLATVLAPQRVAAPPSGADDESRSAVDAWVDAYLRLSVTRDLR